MSYNCIYIIHLHNLDDIAVGAAFVRLIVFRVSQQHSVHVGARILEQFVGAVKDDESYLAVTQNAQFVRFLHQAKFPLREGNLNRRQHTNTAPKYTL